MRLVPGDFVLTAEELRAVAGFVLHSAEETLAVFESDEPGDDRPRLAVDAARLFVEGAPRTMLQRTISLDAHRAATQATTERATLAARAAGDAASAAYLHPIAKAHQVGHVLRAAACEARIAEIDADDPAVGERSIVRARRRAAPVVVEVLGRYPSAPPGRGRVTWLMSELDRSMRAEGDRG